MTFEEAQNAFERGLAYVQSLVKKSTKQRSRAGAIRRKCIDCTAGNLRDIAECTAVECPLWPYRLGKDPFRKERTGGASRRGAVASSSERT